MTTAKDTANGGIPSEIELMLPWYAAGTLSPSEARQVEAALAGDPELASRYEWVRAELAQETAIGETAGEPPASDVSTLFAKIDSLPARQRQTSTTTLRFGDRVAEFFASLAPRTLAWSAAVAALAIVLQAGILAGMFIKEKNAAGYETASAPTNAPGEGAYVLIRFAPQATAADITGFLEANKLNIVAGPSGGQLYKVRVASTKLAKEDLTRIVNRLQNDKVVGFVAAAE